MKVLTLTEKNGKYTLDVELSSGEKKTISINALSVLEILLVSKECTEQEIIERLNILLTAFPTNKRA